MSRLLKWMISKVCEDTAAECAIVYPYDPFRKQFYERERITTWGMQSDPDHTDRPREYGLASIVRRSRLVIAHNISEGKIEVDLTALQSLGISDKQRVLDVIRESPFIHMEKIQSFVGISLIASAKKDMRVTNEALGVFYVCHRRPHRFLADELREVRECADLVSDAIQSIQDFEVASRRAQQTEVVYRTVLSATSGMDFRRLYQTIANEALSWLRGKASFLYRYNDGEDNIRLVAASGVTQGKFSQNHQLPVGFGIAGQVAQTIQPMLVSQYKDHDNSQKEFGAYFSEIVAVPVTRDNAPIGVLVVVDQEGRAFSQDDQASLKQLGETAALAINASELLGQDQELHRQAGASQKLLDSISSSLELREAAEIILDGLGSLIAFDRASVQVFKGNIRKLIAWRGFSENQIDSYLLRPISEDKLIEQIVRQKHPLILPDTSKEPKWEVKTKAGVVKSWVALPLVYGDVAVGIITLDSLTPGHFQVSDSPKLERFGSQAAIALQNAKLLEEVKNRVRELEIY
ncbi:MAG: GAF domain-containing protein, partial [Anaerolineales bacterium]